MQELCLCPEAEVSESDNESTSSDKDHFVEVVDWCRETANPTIGKERKL